MKVYIAGPMTGLPDHNFPAFFEAEEQIRADGHDVLNPARHGVVPILTWSDYMRMGIQDLLRCDAIFMLPGWVGSKGASLELHIAQQLGMKTIYQSQMMAI